ncbi:MAG: type II toxin-antitoxin system HipA family toxin, partial [Proteobacteria bacterium]
MIERLQVRLNIGDLDLAVGELVEVNRQYLFTYAPEFPSETLRLSPFKLSANKNIVHQVSESDRRVFQGIHGVFADSMPDGWGLLLIKRSVESLGHSFADLTPLDILTYVGDRSLGSLRYTPVQVLEGSDAPTNLDLGKLGLESEKVFEGEESKILASLFKLGGSPGGARPKVLAIVGKDGKSRKIKSDLGALPDGFEHWIIKFRGKGDSVDDALAEFHYMQAAKNAGLNVPEADLFQADGKHFFGVKRFDVDSSDRRLHMHTLAGLLHADFRTPALDYSAFLKATKLLTGSLADVKMGFRMAVFNVLFHNRDDHAKNFSYLMDQEGTWKLAPAYDLTYSTGPGGEHTTAILGLGKNISDGKLLELASGANI